MGTTPRNRRKAPSPPPQDLAAAVALLETFRSDPPGWWADNRFEQVKHFVGLTYIAINAVMDAHYGATVQVMQRQRRDAGRITFGPGGTVAKALPGAHSQANDEEYTPFDDDDHPLMKWINYPNEHQCFADQLSYLIMQLLLTGEQYVWAVPNLQGKPVESYALPSAFTTPHLQPGQSLNYPNGAYRVQPTQLGGWGFAVGRLATNAILPVEEVKRHIKPHPWYLWSGYSPLTAGSLTLDILEAIDRSRWSAMEHGPQLDAVLMVPGLTDENAIKKIQEKMSKAHAGSRNARKFGVIGLPAGSSAQGALQNFGANARELDFNGSWSQVAQIVLALFGVPKGVVGLDDTENYSKLYAELRQFYHRQTNSAKQQSEFFSRCFAAPWCSFPGEFKIQIDLPKPEDPELMEKQLATDIQASAITVNQLCALRGRPMVEGGDVPPRVYEQMLLQKMAPQPAPASGAGGDAGAGAPGAEGETGDAEQGDPTQDAATQAALQALGVLDEGDSGQVGEQEQQPPVQKARVVRNEGETWNSGGKWYTKKNGQIYQTRAPGAPTIRVTKPGGVARPRGIAPASAVRPVAMPVTPTARGVAMPVGKPAGATAANAGQQNAGGMKAPWEMSAAESKAAGIKYYRTAQGSLYAVNPKTGQTIRVKSNHAGVGHDASDVGLKTPSAKTVYVDPKIASALSTAGMTGPDGKPPKARVVIHNGKATLLTKNAKTGQWGSAPSGTNIPVSDKPSKGLAPLELWQKRDDIPGHEAYGGMHAGNAITEEVDHDTGHQQITAAAKAAGKTTGGSSASPAMPAPAATATHAELPDLVKQISANKDARRFGLTPQTLAKMPEDAVRQIAHGMGIAGAQKPAAPAATGQPPKVHPQAFEHAAKSVPAHTPEAQATLARVGEWAAAKADQHADRVAQHFGISRQQAHALLVHAITQVAGHAVKSGGAASGTLTGAGKQLRIGVKQKPLAGSTPTGGGPPRPANPASRGTGVPRVAKSMGMGEMAGSAGGFLVAPGGSVMTKKKRGVKRVLARIKDRYKE